MVFFKVEEELWEEAFIEACFEEMLEEEESQWQYYQSGLQPDMCSRSGEQCLYEGVQSQVCPVLYV